MRNQHSNRAYASQMSTINWPISKQTTVGIILIVSLLAFEIFNFDTTRYALRNLIGDVRFGRIMWASILAIAFCSIDFAGLIRLFTPEQGADEPKVVWYLMGAWLMGATMNAVMTWWAISLTLLDHNFGNEVLTREQLLLYVPIFVALLVWLTRILFIGAFTVAGEHIFEFGAQQKKSTKKYAKSNEGTQTNSRSNNTGYRRQQPAVSRVAAPRQTTHSTAMRAAPKSQNRLTPAQLNADETDPRYYDQSEQIVRQDSMPKPVRQATASRVRQRPPRPHVNGGFNKNPAGMKAKGNDRH